MLTENELRALIIVRMFTMKDDCNQTHTMHVLGQVRGLIAAMNGGTLPKFSWDAGDYYDAAGIPYVSKVNDDGELFAEVSDEYLASIGCTSDEDGYVYHPKFNPA